MPSRRLSSEYEPGLIDASKSALLELSITLGEFRDSIVLVGGWAPYFLIEEFGSDDFSHIGSIDIDLAINPETIDQNSYAGIIERIESRGYSQKVDKNGGPVFFSYVKPIASALDHKEYTIQVDFLTSRDFSAGRHRHRIVQKDLRARVCEESATAFRNKFVKRISGILPGNGEASSDIQIVDISGCLAMKGIVMDMRYKEKDAYDIYTVVSKCLKSPTEVAKDVSVHLDDYYVMKGLELIKERFRDIRSVGPTWVADFLEPIDQTAKERTIAEVHVKMGEFINNLPS